MTQEEKLRSKELRLSNARELLRQIKANGFIITTKEDRLIPCEEYDKDRIKDILIKGIEESIALIENETV